MQPAFQHVITHSPAACGEIGARYISQFCTLHSLRTGVLGKEHLSLSHLHCIFHQCSGLLQKSTEVGDPKAALPPFYNRKKYSAIIISVVAVANYIYESFQFSLRGANNSYLNHSHEWLKINRLICPLVCLGDRLTLDH